MLLYEQGITYSMSRADGVWDNSAMEGFFGSLKIERTPRKGFRPRCQACSDVFATARRPQGERGLVFSKSPPLSV